MSRTKSTGLNDCLSRSRSKPTRSSLQRWQCPESRGSQAFTEGNKRTALLVGRWILDRNGADGLRFIPEDDTKLASLLLSAARGVDESDHVKELFDSRR